MGGPEPVDTSKGRDLIARRHPEWREHVIRWRWLLDTLEGGDRYRQASYGIDSRGLPIRNLIRHKREYPDPRELSTDRDSTYLGGPASGLAGMVNTAGSPGGFGPGTFGSDPASVATDDDYEMRRARTPVPTFLAEVIGIHLGKIFAKEVTRTVPDSMPDLLDWLADVDGLGTSIDEWMAETVAPLLLTLGQLDLCFDHPPPRAAVNSRLDEMEQGLDGCIAGYLLPENVVWWLLDDKRRYSRVLVREWDGQDQGEGSERWRFWTGEASYLYDCKGELIDTHPHRFGRPPILRLFDRRKPRCRNIGHPRHEGIAERQREYYNRDSELILSDTTQAHPLLQGPEDFVSADGSIPIGPAWLLPKKKNTSGGTASYEGFDVVDFPKGGADSIRLNKSDIRDDVDRDAGLTKPAGGQGSSKGTVAQSGISKQLDQQNGNTKLTDQAKILARAEKQILAAVLTVLEDNPAAGMKAAEVTIEYPMVFDLSSAQEYTADWAAFQMILESATSCVETQVAVLVEAVRKILPGRNDDFYAMVEEEVRDKIQTNVDRESQAVEMELNPPEPPPIPSSMTPDSQPNLIPPMLTQPQQTV